MAGAGAVLPWELSALFMPSSNPAEVDISKSSGVNIVWKDGHRSEYQLQYLRDRCPCATCGQKQPQAAAASAVANPLPLFKPRARIQEVETVGHYAFRFFWNDGHSTGIYSDDYLRSICPCAECATVRA